jgi:aspartate-semialdehyde dehydrogenase (non-peptidoglycan organisms)
MRKLSVGVLGATGMVGQNYVTLLENHPWFEVAYVAASPRSAGKSYGDAVKGRWHMGRELDPRVAGLVVRDANDVSAAVGHCDFVFSALEMGKDEIRELENAYAAAGIPVVSNASAHRSTPNVPMLITEVNPEHIDVIAAQRAANGWDKGFVAVKCNCSIQGYMMPMHALRKAGYPISRMIVTTLQAVSGAGYPGVPSLDMVDNIVPYIGGEEEKSEFEPRKIFGRVAGGVIVPDESFKIAAHCTRVPVSDGHSVTASLEFAGKKPSLEEIISIWESYKSLPQELRLPSAPERPIIYRREDNRPQPKMDRDAERGMAVVVGRLRPCPVFDIRFVGLAHNTIRGAAGGGILNAELLKARGYLG